MKKITLFSWGYWGWGSTAKQFVNSVDALEVSRGFKPPMFVDIRISRAARAKNFSGKAFEELVGSTRYRWMSSLGNAALQNSWGAQIKIKDPDSVRELFDLVLEADKNKQRVIMFCACEFPGTEFNPSCHRVVVAELLKKYATKKKNSIHVIEWPGGTPDFIELNLNQADYKKLLREGKTIPLEKAMGHKKYAGIAWGSIAKVRCGNEEALLMVGPPKFSKDKWVLPVLSKPNAPELFKNPFKSFVKRWREEKGFESSLR